MFTLEQARELHRKLPVFDLRVPGADDPLTRAYLDHYQLSGMSAPYPVRHSMGSFPCLDFRLAGHHFAVPDEVCTGTLVIVHGYYDHVGLYRHPIEYGLGRGLSVLTFDLPGHGLSGGDPASIRSFDHYSQALVDCLTVAREQGLAGPLLLMAQSTGAAAVINILVKKQRFPIPDFSQILLLAPLLRPVDWVSSLRKFHLMRWFLRKVDRTFAVNSHDEEFLRFIAEDDPLQARDLMVDWVAALRQYLKEFDVAANQDDRLDIIQGTDDTTVDWQYNLPRLRHKFPRAFTHTIDGARHHLVNESSRYRQKLFDLVDDILDGKVDS